MGVSQGGLAGVLSLLEGDEFVRGILEPAGLTMDDLARPSIDSCRKLSVPPPPTDSAIPSKRAPRYQPFCHIDILKCAHRDTPCTLDLPHGQETGGC